LEVTYDEPQSKVTFKINLRRYIEDNEADIWGGGVFAWQSVITLDANSMVTHNVAPLGGGVYLLGRA
jgi:hypothetical protein